MAFQGFKIIDYRFAVLVLFIFIDCFKCQLCSQGFKNDLQTLSLKALLHTLYLFDDQLAV